MTRKTVYNSITSAEKLSLVNPDNLDLMEDFLEYLSSIDRSPATIKQYRADLKIFWCWNLEHNKNKYFVDLKKREIAKFQNYAINTWGWSPKRTKRVKSVLSSLSNYIEDILDDEIEDFKPIIRKIENPKDIAVREKSVIPDHLVELLLNTLVEKHKYEQACAVAVAASSGMRKSELLQMKMSYFNEEHLKYEGLYETPKIRTKGHGKLGTPMEKYIMVDAKYYVDLWAKQRDELGIECDDMFVVRNADDTDWIPRKNVDHWTKTFSHIIGMPFYFHALRHYVCTKLHKYNLPAPVIQEFFGWASADMMQIYNDLSAKDDFGKFFTKDGLVEGKTGSLSEVK